MDKFNPMFSIRSTSEMKNFYKNPTIIISVVALLLIVISCFIPMYMQPNGIGVTVGNLLHNEEGFKTVVMIFLILDIVLAVATLVMSFLFKNTPKLSGLIMILGGLILLGAIFELIYCTKIGFPNDSNGTTVANFNMSFGGFAVILASLLIIGNEFYKLGWQGYEVEEKDANAQSNASVNAEEVAKVDELKEEVSTEKTSEDVEIKNDENIETSEETTSEETTSEDKK